MEIISNNDNVILNDVVNNLLNIISVNNETNVIKKKRGRPKKILDSNNNMYEPKKRGRKPKDQQIVNKEVKDNEREIILHMQLSLDDIKRYGSVDIMENLNKHLNKSNESSNHENIFTIDDHNFDDDSTNESNEEINKLMEIIKEKDEYIKTMDKELNQYKMLEKENNEYMYQTKITKMNVNLVNVHNGETIIVERTDIVCWWCTEQFETLPCFIPEKVINNCYHVYGCFCSFNCAAAYNLNSSVNDYKVWEKNSLIKSLCNEMTQTYDDIYIAPPKEILIKYGGHLSIMEYRKNFNLIKKEYRLVIPPMTPIIPFIEERTSDNQKNNKFQKNDSALILKRKKPLPGSKANVIDTLDMLRQKE